MNIFKRPKIPRHQRLAKLTLEQQERLVEIEAQAIMDFKGQGTELESAIGMLRLGHHVGWKVLYIMHSKATIRKYEEILTGSAKEPVRVRGLFDEDGPSSPRSLGYRISQVASNFWRFISGEAEDAKADRAQRGLIEK